MALLDRNGNEVGEILSENGVRHRPLGYSEIPEFTKSALIALEDRRFRSHFGLDPRGVVRAFYRNLREGGIREGASTLNTGLVRNSLWIEEERTWGKKLLEAAYALRVDGKYPKEKILSEYLNRISFGRLSKGFAAASRSYFGKEPRNLTQAEQIALLAMAKNPAKYDPAKNPATFRTRFESVVSALVEAGVVNSSDSPALLAEKLSFPVPKNALPYVTDAFRSGKLATGESHGTPFLRTTFDLDLTRRVKKIADGTLADISWRNVSDYGILLVDRKTKEVLTLIGGADYFSGEGGQVNSVFAPRQVGSTAKPFTYLLAMQERGVSPEDTVLDLPVAFETAEGTPYEPKNYSLSYRGAVTVSEALAGSLNVPAVKMAEKVGVGELLRFLRSLGITTLTEDADHYGLALTLGVGEIPLYELLRAYTVFSDAGKLCGFVTVPDEKADCRKAAEPSAALKIESILTNRAFKLREFGALTALDFPDRFVFVKTGTSRNFRDNYAIGYTNRYLLAVWSGNKDGSNMKGVSGATGAGEIFSRLVTSLEPPGGAPENVTLHADGNGYLEIVTPLESSRYRNDPAIPARTQTVVPKFATGIPFDHSVWTLDGAPLPKEGVVIPNLAVGLHKITVTLYSGREKLAEKTVEFSVEK